MDAVFFLPQKLCPQLDELSMKTMYSHCITLNSIFARSSISTLSHWDARIQCMQHLYLFTSLTLPGLHSNRTFSTLYGMPWTWVLKTLVIKIVHETFQWRAKVLKTSSASRIYYNILHKYLHRSVVRFAELTSIWEHCIKAVRQYFNKGLQFSLTVILVNEGYLVKFKVCLLKNYVFWRWRNRCPN